MRVSGNGIIYEIERKDLVAGVLDLNEYVRSLHGYKDEVYLINRLQISMNSFNGCYPSAIYFPKKIILDIQSGERSLGSYGVRTFNVPIEYERIINGAKYYHEPGYYNISEFIYYITGVDVANITNKINGYHSELQFSEYTEVLKAISPTDVLSLCTYYEGISWLDELIDAKKQAIEDIKKNMPVMNSDTVELQTLCDLKTVIENGKLWNTEWIVDESTTCRIGKDYKLYINMNLEGDIYDIRIDNIDYSSKVSVSYPKELNQLLLKLLCNKEYASYIIKSSIDEMNKKQELEKQAKAAADKAVADELIRVQQEEQEAQRQKERIEKVLLSPAVQQARLLQIKYGDEAYIPNERKMPIDDKFFVDYFDILRAMGIINYLNLSRINLSNYNLEYFDLSNLRISLDLSSLKYKSLRGANLENVPLLGQSLADFDIRGANLKGTHAFIDYGSTVFDETTIFDETCQFFEPDGFTIPRNELIERGINIEPKAEVELKV